MSATLRSVSDVTRILDRVQPGEGQAAEEFPPLVYVNIHVLELG